MYHRLELRYNRIKIIRVLPVKTLHNLNHQMVELKFTSLNEAFLPPKKFFDGISPVPSDVQGSCPLEKWNPLFSIVT